MAQTAHVPTGNCGWRLAFVHNERDEGGRQEPAREIRIHVERERERKRERGRKLSSPRHDLRRRTERERKRARERAA